MMIGFYEWFPELAETESLSIALAPEEAKRAGLPAGQYFCSEQVCPNAACDCREVLLSVVSNRLSGLVASLMVRFDSAQPHVELFRDGLQSQHSEKFACLLGERLQREPALVAQLKRHYGLVKKRASRAAARQELFSPLQSKF